VILKYFDMEYGDTLRMNENACHKRRCASLSL